MLTLGGCSSDSDLASRNLSTEAERFEVDRQIVFSNGVTDAYVLEIQGRCSVDPAESLDALEVTCEVGDGEYEQHLLGLSDKTTCFVEQLESRDVSTYHDEVAFEPESIVPDDDLSTSSDGG
ncbi:hypothetical protein [Quadrisphaera setariae]|uniref:beta-sandwich lipoprotein n=1 Tax=Quadrisphaera setariae TaxID=2593304 RepID=UPI001C9BD846|nr:hypothetical protein [Quadrisphaera setariae]